MLTFPLDLTLNCCHGIIMVIQVMESWKIGKIENWKVKELIFEVDLTLHCCHFFLTSTPKSRKIFPQQSRFVQLTETRSAVAIFSPAFLYKCMDSREVTILHLAFIFDLLQPFAAL